MDAAADQYEIRALAPDAGEADNRSAVRNIFSVRIAADAVAIFDPYDLQGKVPRTAADPAADDFGKFEVTRLPAGNAVLGIEDEQEGFFRFRTGCVLQPEQLAENGPEDFNRLPVFIFLVRNGRR